MWRLPHCQIYLVVPVLLVVFSILIPSYSTNVSILDNRRPHVVNIGALFAFNSTIGRVAKTAIELAVKDVNSDETLLNRTKLKLTMVDSMCNVFLGTAQALELLKKGVVAVAGPQFSDLAHVVSHVANGIQTPLLSFATDPTLTSHEYPYFIRMTNSDVFQMEAIAAFVDAYGWREVVAVYTDDDYGRNGITALGDALVSVGAEITMKVPMIPGVNRSEMSDVLAKLALMDTRVFVVHMYSNAGLNFFAEAKDIGMLSTGYVWIATDWLTSVLDSGPLEVDSMNSLQGLISLRPHTPNSGRQAVLRQKWRKLQTANLVNVSLSAFGLYAYDSIMMIANSINTFLNQGGKISFAERSIPSSAGGGDSELAELKVFEGGAQLRNIILKTYFEGTAGPVELDKNRDLMGSTFEIINIVGRGFPRIAYWSQRMGLSVTSPEITANSDNQSHTKTKLSGVIWPGESETVPRGWVSGKQLVIGVPRKAGFKEFVNVTTTKGSSVVKGYCIDVFVSAVKLLSYTVHYTFKSYGTGNSTPNYDDLVKQVALQNFDAVVGDISIVKNRSNIVDFTQPYVATGLVVVVPVKEIGSDPWAFLHPFSAEMWGTTGALFLIIGAVVWLLEHRINPEFRGPPKKQLSNVLWFSFSTLFFSHKENTKSTLARAVLIIWLFVILIISQSYTASLTTILTLQRLSTKIQGINSLVASNLPIGYQTGSYVKEYLSETFSIAKSRLVPLDSIHSYAEALSLGPNKGGVAAVVDELPYIQLFLSKHCGFTIVGGQFSQSGWGFVFPKNSPLAPDMSTAILALSESGKLQSINNKWWKHDECDKKNSQVEFNSNKLALNRFWGLFLLIGIVCIIALLVFFCRMVYLFTRDAGRYIEDSNHGSRSFISRSARILKAFCSYALRDDDHERNEQLQKKASEKMKMDVHSGI